MTPHRSVLVSRISHPPPSSPSFSNLPFRFLANAALHDPSSYEDRIADLKRQIESLRAQQGTGPPIPSVIPATTNHFGSLMGHPHGMFNQAGPEGPLQAGGGGNGNERGTGHSGSNNPAMVASAPGPSSGANGASNASPSTSTNVRHLPPGSTAAMQIDDRERDYASGRERDFPTIREQREREQREREREREKDREREREREREYSQSISQHQQQQPPPPSNGPSVRDGRERSHFAGAVNASTAAAAAAAGDHQHAQHHLGKRARGDLGDSTSSYDGQPPALKSRTAGPGPMEGVRAENGECGVV